MLNQLEQAQQKWGGTHQTIDVWLQERKELLVKFCALAGLPPFEQLPAALPKRQDITAFCEVLMDYISAGHFELYDKISAQCDSMNSENLSVKLVPQITESTEIALTFHDTYADIDNATELEHFDARLSQLGQLLEDRFALEDQLIQQLHIQNA